jgi:hypothetical protein
VVLQTGVVPMQFAFEVHWTQMPGSVLQTAPGQSVSSTHSTQAWVVLQTGVAGLEQSVFCAHSTQMPSSGSPKQMGVVPGQTSLPGAQTQVWRSGSQRLLVPVH